MSEAHFTYPHKTDPDIFREALAYSEADKGFTASLIEKDYYCSPLLQYLFSSDTSLVFKGGTCLSKVHADFYRLSEDLDFIVPVDTVRTRPQRRAAIKPVKSLFEKLQQAVPGITITEAFRGHNESRQSRGLLQQGTDIFQVGQNPLGILIVFTAMDMVFVETETVIHAFRLLVCFFQQTARTFP